MPHAAPYASRHQPVGADTDLAAVARFLRALAEQVERDAAFGRQLAALLVESGLFDGGAAPAPARRAPRAGGAARRGVDEPATTERLDPLVLLRHKGEDALRTRLGALSTAELHAVIRAHRLDPARVSARWKTDARLVELIVEQVRARADQGNAFARV